MDNDLRFDLTLAELPVIIGGEGYVLKELDGAGRDRYLNSLAQRIRVNKAGETAGVKNFTALQATLVAMSLHGPDGEPVNVKTIQSWPSKVVAALFAKAKELSGLGDEDEEDEEGNV